MICINLSSHPLKKSFSDIKQKAIRIRLGRITILVRIFFFGISLQLDVLIVPCKPQTFPFFNTRGTSFSLNVSPDTAPRFSKKLLTVPKYLLFSRFP